MNIIYKTLNNIQTSLLVWGDPFNCNGSDVIICITGNPGFIDFYIEFASELNKNLGIPVCVIGHAGHDTVLDEKSNVLRGQEHLFNLNGQIKHKAELIKLVDKRSKLHLIGHSIGSWIIIEMLDRYPDFIQRTASVNFLFPTVQKMAVSPNGKHINHVIRRLHVFVMFLFTLLNLMPIFIKHFIINCYIRLQSLPAIYKERVLKYLDPRVAEKVLFMAYEEMDRVTTLNTEGIDNIKHLTTVVYAENDGWAPVAYMEDFKQFQPPLQMKEVRIDHAFVLKSSEAVAEIVYQIISHRRAIDT